MRQRWLKWAMPVILMIVATISLYLWFSNFSNFTVAQRLPGADGKPAMSSIENKNPEHASSLSTNNQ